MSTAASAPRPSSPASAGGPTRRRGLGPLTTTFLIVLALMLAFFWFAGFYADILWFDQLGFLSVLTTQWASMAVMFLIGFAAMAIPVAICLQIAYRARPVYAKLNAQLDRYQEVIEPLRRAAMIGGPIVLGLFTGLVVAPAWPTAQQFLHGKMFGVVDPEFGLDVGFYMFQLPFWRGLVAIASGIALVCLLATVMTNYLYGGIRITGRDLVITKPARIAIAVLAALYLLLQAVSFWLDRYELVVDGNGKWSGAMYSDVHATIPGLAIVSGAAAIVAVLFLIAAAVGRWRLPLIGSALLVVVGLIVGSAYPGLVQALQVGPSEQQLEAPYIERNIEATRHAYGIDEVVEESYSATTTASAGQLREDAATTTNLRLLDPNVLTQTFAQNEQERAYYGFPEDLDVDRYTIDGQVRDAVVAVRDVNLGGLGADAQSWVNQALVYTHGYGIVAAYGNQRSSDGTPVYFAQGMPQAGDLDVVEPRVYFGESSPAYSIVGAPAGATPVELDYAAGADGATQTYTTFEGNGGPKLDSLLNRLVYALKFQSEQIFLSENVTDQSQILYHRDPAERVRKVAPYLTIDSDPYPSVVDGQIVWIVDGYTTSDAYPYSAQRSLGQMITDTRTQTTIPFDEINYIRNSVKATVNAYDGSVHLYAWDPSDPVLQTWSEIFPSTIEPMESMSADLMAHVRYPSDLFKVQRQMLASYHVTDPNVFYSQLNAWQTPADPTGGANAPAQPPYYLTMQMPGQHPAYSIYSTFIPQQNPNGESRNVLTGYLSANSNAGSTPGQIDPGYGKLTLLRIDNAAVPGPGQVQNAFTSDPTVSNELNILAQGNTAVIHGNLLTVPVGEGFLYVQPVYVQSKGETSYPILQRVLVAFGDKIAFKPTLEEALNALFGGDSGADAGDAATSPGGASDPGAATQTLTTQQQLSQAIADASQALTDRTTAYQQNDVVGAAAADKRLQDALARVTALDSQLQAELGGQAPAGGAATTTPPPADPAATAAPNAPAPTPTP
ncbi:hypothetical protein USB125703_01463 [Pseudoclavibacter triregionum]|nr:hypothetical protein USB125703_01463 [Pseudoclavibacter triregionum]